MVMPQQLLCGRVSSQMPRGNVNALALKDIFPESMIFSNYKDMKLLTTEAIRDGYCLDAGRLRKPNVLLHVHSLNNVNK